jgi:hypothetical protein
MLRVFQSNLHWIRTVAFYWRRRVSRSALPRSEISN